MRQPIRAAIERYAVLAPRRRDIEVSRGKPILREHLDVIIFRVNKLHKKQLNMQDMRTCIEKFQRLSAERTGNLHALIQEATEHIDEDTYRRRERRHARARAMAARLLDDATLRRPRKRRRKKHEPEISWREAHASGLAVWLVLQRIELERALRAQTEPWLPLTTPGRHR